MDIGEIQDVTDSLALMADPALQQYAQMHKDDPYIVSLAMSESNRRKKMRAAQQGQAGQMPPPKVVDQAISAINPPPPQPQPMPQQGMPPQGAPQQPPQGMPPQGMPQAQTQLPEDQGIAQLPAPNMQGMADGGIVGYAPGGYAVGESIPEGAMIMGNMYIDPNTGERKYLPGAEPKRSSMAGMSIGEGLSKAGKYAKEKLEDLLISGEYSKKKTTERRQAEAAAEAAAAAPPVKPPPVTPAILAPTGAGQGQGQRGAPALTPVNDTVLAERLAATDNTGIGRPPTGEGAAPAGGLPTLTTATTPADAAAELNAIKSAQSPSVPTEIASALDEVGLAKRTAIDAEETQRQKDIAAMGTAFSDREARLKAKQGRVEAQEKDLGAMALMQAGFAMMSGTSPHALSNIGAGATIGLKTYQDGLEKIENAKDKLDDAFGRIEEFRRNESMLNAKEKRKYARELSDTFTETKKAYTDVLVKDWGVKQDDARIIYSSVVAERRELNNQKFQAGENAANRANASANARLQASLRQDPLALYKELADPNSKVAKGYAAAKQEAIEPTLFAQYEKMAGDSTVNVGGSGKYLTKGEEFTAKYPNAQAYVKAYRNALGSEGTIPPAGGSGFTIVGSRPAK
jgi:hypothetical protein